MLIDQYTASNTSQAWYDATHDYIGKVFEDHGALASYRTRHPDHGRRIDTLRSEVLQAFPKLAEQCGWLTYAYAQEWGMPPHEDGEKELDRDTLGGLGTAADTAWKASVEAILNLSNALNGEIETVWTRIRDLERAAVG